MRTIICGGDVERHFGRLGVAPVKTFDGLRFGHRLAVWRVSPFDFKRLCDDERKDLWVDAWWRECGGSNLGPCNSTASVNGHTIVAWNRAWNKDDEEWDPVEADYRDVFEYLCNHVGVSTERNLAAVLPDLACANGADLGPFLSMLAARTPPEGTREDEKS